MEMTMDDLRRAAIGCFKMAPKEVQDVSEEIFKAMDPENNGCVRFSEYSEYIELVGCPNLSSKEFFNELKQGENDGLYFDDILTLLYVVHTKWPFCQGKCERFVKGIYFTCHKCFFDQEHEGEGPTFSVCSQCFSDQTFNHKHHCKQFMVMDPMFLLDQYKKLEPLSKSTFKRQSSNMMDAGGSSTTTTASGAESDGGTIGGGGKGRKSKRSSTSKNNKKKKCVQFAQVVASVGGVMVASQLCTIM